MNEEFLGVNQEPTDTQGNPWTETHPIPVLRRLTFLQRIFRDHQTEPQTPNPFPPKPRNILNVDPANVTSMQEFIDRHRRRGPYKK